MKSNEFVQKEVDTRMLKDEKKEKKRKKDMLVIFRERMRGLGLVLYTKVVKKVQRFIRHATI